MESPHNQSDLSSLLRFSSSNSSDYWEMIEKKANDYLDAINVYKGDPLMKQDRYFEKNKMIMLNLRKSSTHSLEGSSLTLNMSYKKKKSCIDFKKANSQFRPCLRSLNSEEGL